MWPLLLLALMATGKRRPGDNVVRLPQRGRPTDAKRLEMVALIRSVARSAGVEESIALAFADVESGFDPLARGDLNWPFAAGGAKYRKNVLENERLALNPWRGVAEVWHSYGLFQLLAPYHVEARENPSILYDPRINAERGVAKIRRLLAAADGDVLSARLRYVGCGPDGSLCSAQKVADTKNRLAAALQRWEAP